MRPTIALAVTFASLFLASCGNPGGISDEDYRKFNQLGAPKLLYSCTSEMDRLDLCRLQEGSVSGCLSIARPFEKVTYENVGYVAGIGPGATYNKLLTDAQEECVGDFKILKSAH